MNIFSTIFNALKDGTTQMGETPVDTSDIAIFERELQNARLSFGKAKESQAAIKAQHHQTQTKVNTHNHLITTKKEQALLAVSQSNESLALAIASEIVSMEQNKANDEILLSQLNANLDKLAQQIELVHASIKEMENHLSQVKATESVHKAQASIHASQHASKDSVLSARDSLARIKAQQEQAQAHIDVAGEVDSFLNDNNQQQLDAKLKASEDVRTRSSAAANAQDVLNRLKNEK